MKMQIFIYVTHLISIYFILLIQDEAPAPDRGAALELVNEQEGANARGEALASMVSILICLTIQKGMAADEGPRALRLGNKDSTINPTSG